MMTEEVMRKTVFMLLFMLLPVSSHALEKSDVEKMMKTPVKSLEPTPVPGVLEAVTDDNRVVYIDESGRYLFVGNLLDMVRRVNITQSRMDELTVVDFSSLPLEDAIVEGDGQVKLAVFDDPDCPYCRKLHRELKELENVQLYYFMINLPMHPKAYDKAKKILCAEDKMKALDRAMNGESLDDLEICQTDVVDRNKELSERLGIKGTPHMILESGKAIRGYKTAKDIQKAVDGVIAEASAAASSGEEKE